MDPYTIAIIAVGSVIGLVIMYFMAKRIIKALNWFWAVVLGPPCKWVYRTIFTPIGHCGRDCVFVWKEACCNCGDSCDMCCNPYKRI